MYSLTKENELIRSAQAGSQSACEELYATYEGLIQNMRRRYAYTPTGQTIADDALGILQLAFMEAIKDFIPSRGINFAAFLQSRLHGAIYKAFKQACRYNQHTAHPATTNAEDNHDYFDMLESPQPTPEQKILAKTELALVLHQLNPQEQELLHLLYIQDMPQTNAARLLHISPQALHKRKQKLISKLKKLA